MPKEDKKTANVKGTKPFVLKSTNGKFDQKSKQEFGDGGKSKFPRRIKRNDLVAQKEKLKMMHKYKKMMRKERQEELGSRRDAATTSQLKKKITFPRINFNKEDKTYLTANKKAQAEYEDKKRQREAELEDKRKVDEEKANALKNYKKGKKEKFKSLCKKKGNGQLLMGKQIGSLLEKIEKSVKNK